MPLNNGFKKSPRRAPDLLRVQVFQGPALQCELSRPLGRRQRIRMGKSERMELALPFSNFASPITLFTLTPWGAKVHLDPRIEGFVSDGQRFGDVHDYIAPRGALKELASVLEPLEVSVPLGSRGTLEVGGYTVVFRVDKPKELVKKPHIEGAPKAPFALPESNSLMEKYGFLLGVGLSAMVSVPALFWLSKAPLREFQSIRDLTPMLAAEIVHPDHFQILPWAFGNEFMASKIVPQALHWTNELRRKWDSEEVGLAYSSDVPALRGFSQPETRGMRQKEWQATLATSWRKRADFKDTAAAGSFIQGQVAYAPLQVAVSGGVRGSLSERAKARIEKLNNTHASIVSLIETEHGYMKTHFKEMNAEIKEIFDPPKETGLFFRLAEPAFSEERKNYHAAESFAALAREKRKRLTASVGTVTAAASEPAPLVWSSESLVVPDILSLPADPMWSGNEGDLLRNIKLSLGSIAPPPAPKPKPYIDMTEVEAYVRGQSPEVKACYDTALNRNPDLGGTVLWQWTIAPSGRIARSKVVRTSIKDKLFLVCLESKMRRWVFPRPMNGAITVSFPFRFLVRENRETLERMAR